MRPGRRTRLFVVLGFALVLTLVLAPEGSAELIVGNGRDSKLAGTQKRDDVYGRDGRDVLIGFGGWGRLYGEEGDDILPGEAGSDRLWEAVETTRSTAASAPTASGRVGGRTSTPARGTTRSGPARTTAAMDVIDCGDGIDRVVVNRSDRFFNCEQYTRLRGQRVPGRVWVDTSDSDYWNNSAGWYRDILLGLGGDYLNGNAGPDIIFGNEGNDSLDDDHGPDLLLGGPDGDTLWGTTATTASGAVSGSTYSTATGRSTIPATATTRSSRSRPTARSA